MIKVDNIRIRLPTFFLAALFRFIKFLSILYYYCGQFPISSAGSHRFLFFIEKTRIVFDQVLAKQGACSAERGVLARNSYFSRKKSCFISCLPVSLWYNITYDRQKQYLTERMRIALFPSSLAASRRGDIIQTGRRNMRFITITNKKEEQLSALLFTGLQDISFKQFLIQFLNALNDGSLLKTCDTGESNPRQPD